MRVRSLVEGLLFTDQYQLTMAQLYWRYGLAERRVSFDYFFRRYPDYGVHQAGYAVFAGLGPLLEWMEMTQVTAADLEQLRSQRGSGGRPRFDEGFLTWLGDAGGFEQLTVRALPEGRVAHAGAPVAIVEGPLAMAQILESSFLNHLNYQTLIATKAARVAESAQGAPVLEFGMRRGPDIGANAGIRAALIGGADFTSNVGMSAELGTDPKGTHAHSMVQLFMALGEGEIAAFRAYADVYPDDCLLLVDTIDTLGSGVPNAIMVFDELRAAGHEPIGIRLDSGDLAYLAIQAARMLDDAGYPGLQIVLSSDLDELAMWQIGAQIAEEAPRYGIDPEALAARLVYGVGTRLITSHGYSALGGVYKLVAIDESGSWLPAIKVSDSPEKMPIPGAKRVWRVYDTRGLATADVVSALDEELGERSDDLRVHHPHRDGVARTLQPGEVGDVEELLLPVFAGGERCDGRPSLEEMRRRRRADLERLDPGVRRLVNPHRYHVSLTAQVKDLQKTVLADI